MRVVALMSGLSDNYSSHNSVVFKNVLCGLVEQKGHVTIKL